MERIEDSILRVRKRVQDHLEALKRERKAGLWKEGKKPEAYKMGDPRSAICFNCGARFEELRSGCPFCKSSFVE